MTVSFLVIVARHYQTNRKGKIWAKNVLLGSYEVLFWKTLGLLMRENSNCFLVNNILLCHNKLQCKKDQKHIFSRYQKQDKNVMGGFPNFFKDDSRQKNVF